MLFSIWSLFPSQTHTRSLAPADINCNVPTTPNMALKTYEYCASFLLMLDSGWVELSTAVTWLTLPCAAMIRYFIVDSTQAKVVEQFLL